MTDLTIAQEEDLRGINSDAQEIADITDECLQGKCSYLEALRDVRAELRSIEKIVPA